MANNKNNATMNAKATNATPAASKTELLEWLKECLSNFGEKLDSNLAQRVKYCLEQSRKNAKKVLKSDVDELCAEVHGALLKISESAKKAAKPVEASAKPKSALKSKAKAKVEDDDDDEDEPDETETDEEEAPKKSTKKPAKESGKKPTKSEKDETVKTAAATTKAGGILPPAKMFPAEINHPTLGKLIAVPDKFHKYESLVKALEEEKTVYIATYWTKRHIVQYNYGREYNVPVDKNLSFDHDLDIAEVALILESIERCYALSVYTEALYQFEGAEFKPVKDKDLADGSEFSVRVSSGMEFELYIPAEE